MDTDIPPMANSFDEEALAFYRSYEAQTTTFLEKISDGFAEGDDYKAGREVGLLMVFCFQMGRKYESEVKS
jgi:hypothetical protein